MIYTTQKNHSLYEEAISLHKELSEHRNNAESQAKIEDFLNRVGFFMEPSLVIDLRELIHSHDENLILNTKIASLINSAQSNLLKMPEELIGNILNFGSLNDIHKLAPTAKPLSKLADIEQINRLNEGFYVTSLNLSPESLARLLNKDLNKKVTHLRINIPIHHANNFFQNQPNIKYLELSNQENISNVILNILNSDNKLNKLRILNLSYSHIDVEAATFLAEWFKHLKDLEVLNLTFTQTSDEGAMILTQGFKHLKNLRDLNFSHNDLGPEGIQAFTEGLKHLPTLESLNLSSTVRDDENAELLAEGFKYLKNLRNLDFSENFFEYEGALAFTEGLKHLPTLEVLNLSNIEINHPDYINLLTNALRYLEKLQELDLSGNSLLNTEETAVSLAQALQDLKTLNCLCLSDMNINSEVIPALFNGIKDLKNLEYLDLSFNPLSVYDIPSLTKIILALNNLTTLDLSETTLEYSEEVIQNLLPRNYKAELTLGDTCGFRLDEIEQGTKRTIDLISHSL